MAETQLDAGAGWAVWHLFAASLIWSEGIFHGTFNLDFRHVSGSHIWTVNLLFVAGVAELSLAGPTIASVAEPILLHPTCRSWHSCWCGMRRSRLCLSAVGQRLGLKRAPRSGEAKFWTSRGPNTCLFPLPHAPPKPRPMHFLRGPRLERNTCVQQTPRPLSVQCLRPRPRAHIWM